MSERAPQDWRAYVQMAPDMPAEMQGLLSRALDQIWQVRDGEGRHLIEQAGQFAPLQLSITATQNTGYLVGQHGIQFNRGDLEKFCVADRDGQLRHASLTGVLAHELFHAGDRRGDPPLIRQSLYEGLERALDNSTATDEQREAVLVNYATLASVGPDLEKLFTRLGREGRPGNDDHAAFIAELRSAGLMDLAAHLQNTPDFMQRWMQSTGLFDRTGTEHTEADATAFTDHFMAKYFTTEPWRGQYTNSVQCPADTLFLAGVRAVPEVSAGYRSPQDGRLPQVLPPGMQYEAEAALPSAALPATPPRQHAPAPGRSQ
ncbi:MAG: hypothetical protein DI582_00060 [Azospirillum brasilense]|nr:MAG: hypothetical protein DI582_00060 [Azospirillum brasilense]